MTKLTWTQLPQEEQFRIAEVYRNGGQIKEFASHYEMKSHTLIRNVQHFIYYQDLFQKEKVTGATFPQFSDIIYRDYVVLEDENVIVSSDFEIPDADPMMVLLIFIVGIRFNIKRLIIAGDFMATDQAGLNEWVDIWKETGETTFGNALGMAKQTLKGFHRQFDTIDLIEGNHDDRVARATKGDISLNLLLDSSVANYSRYGYLYINTHRGPIYICHPRQFSANSVALGQKLYNVTTTPDGKKCHIILGHTHQPQSGRSPDGLREIYALGCIRDPLKTKYINKNPNTHHKWGQGFMMIRNGYFHPLTLLGTDWEFLLGDLCPAELLREVS